MSTGDRSHKRPSTAATPTVKRKTQRTSEPESITPLPLPLTLGSDGNRWTVGVTGSTMWTEWGREGGKLQRSERQYKSGKQGRSPEAQAAFEARSAARKKLRLGYSPLGDGAGPIAKTTFSPSRADAHPPLPMLATDWNKVKKPQRLLQGFVLQPKLDGIRCVADAQTGRLFSRTGKELTGLPHITGALRLAAQVATPPARWLDGEIYRHGATFQGIVGAARRSVNVDPAVAETLELHLFDIVSDDTATVRLHRLHTWMDAARALVSPGKLDAIKVVHSEDGPACETIEQVNEAIDAAVAKFEDDGFEGAIVRVIGAPYTTRKRSLDLLKAKRFEQEEFDVIGLEERPKQPGTVATVRCRTVAGKEFGATPECTLEEKRDMWDRREEYQDGRWVATVRFQELSDGGIPRFPVCAGLRHIDDR